MYISLRSGRSYVQIPSETEVIHLLRRLLCALLALIVFSLPAQAEPFDPLIRLHVIAADDSPDAQALKLEIRDAVLLRAQTLLSACPDADDAWQTLSEHLTELLDAASVRALQLGCTERLSVQLGVFAFPDRTYGDVVVPAGDYRALRVLIGPAEGQNWWCVLYPNLCLPAGDGYNSALLAWLRSLFGGDDA